MEIAGACGWERHEEAVQGDVVPVWDQGPGATVIATTPVPLPPEAPFDRLTLNEKALKASDEIILVVTGASKRALIEDVLAGNDTYPVAQFLHGDGPPVTIYWSE